VTGPSGPVIAGSEAAKQSSPALDAQVRPAPQAAATSGGRGDLRIFAALAMTKE